MAHNPIRHNCLICQKEFFAIPKTQCCSKSCGATWRHRVNRKKLAAIFWDRFDKSAGPDGCWLWTLGRTKKGYGKIKIEGKSKETHVVAYELTYGEIPPGHLIRHTCDNPPCGNPRHLISGTYSDNRKDMIERGRFGFGEKNGNTKLTTEQILWVRELFSTPQPRGKVAEVAFELGISREHLYLIRKGISWKRID